MYRNKVVASKPTLPKKILLARLCRVDFVKFAVKNYNALIFHGAMGP